MKLRHRSTTQWMLIATFGLLTAWLAAWVTLTPLDIPVPAFDAGTASLWFAPVAALYSTRRYTKAKLPESQEA